MEKKVRIAQVAAYGDTGFTLTLQNEKAQGIGTLILTSDEYKKLGSPTPRQFLTLKIEKIPDK